MAIYANGKRLPKIRLKSVPRPGHSDTEKQAVADSESASRFIMSHPQYKTILDAMREGDKNTEIAKWLAEDGLLTISEKTMQRYLSLFRSRYPQLLKGDLTNRSLDDEVSANRPNMDTEAEIQRLIRLQKRRINRNFRQEETIGVLMPNGFKEIDAARELLKMLATVRGQVKMTGVPLQPQSGMDIEARDTLTHMKADEAQRDEMAAMVGQLIGIGHDG